MKLGKQLSAIRRELIASPKKAVLLALLLAAAAWFWGPILWRKLGGPAAAPTVAQPAATAAGLRQEPGTGSQEPMRRTGPWSLAPGSWNQLLAARQQDLLTQPAVFDPQWPQPFKVQPQEQRDGAANAAGHTSVLLTPSEAGLVLESIVYGKSTRAAVISGEIYHEGSTVTVATAQGTLVGFQLVRIERGSVALERNERTYQLAFPRPKLQGSDRIEANQKATALPALDRP